MCVCVRERESGGIDAKKLTLNDITISHSEYT